MDNRNSNVVKCHAREITVQEGLQQFDFEWGGHLFLAVAARS
jgi:hypothetical protein